LERLLLYGKRFGAGTTLVVIIVLALNWWGVINLSKIPFTHTVDILYAYLIFATLGALRLRKRKRPEVDKLCPQCDSALQSKPHYICPKCGELNFKIKNHIDEKA
jgi:hypothetical protein